MPRSRAEVGPPRRDRPYSPPSTPCASRRSCALDQHQLLTKTEPEKNRGKSEKQCPKYKNIENKVQLLLEMVISLGSDPVNLDPAPQYC